MFIQNVGNYNELLQLSNVSNFLFYNGQLYILLQTKNIFKFLPVSHFQLSFFYYYILLTYHVCRDIVQTLLDAGAQIDHETKSKSTPLR